MNYYSQNPEIVYKALYALSSCEDVRSLEICQGASPETVRLLVEEECIWEGWIPLADQMRFSEDVRAALSAGKIRLINDLAALFEEHGPLDVEIAYSVLKPK